VFDGAVTGLTTLDVTGTTAINTTTVTSTGTQTYGGAVTLGANATLTGTAIDFTSTVTGAQTLTINNSGLFSIQGVMTLGTLDQTGAGLTDIGANVTTNAGGINFSTPVELSANVTLDSSAANGAVSFGSTVDNATAAAESLTVNAGAGNVTFTGAVGGGTNGALAGLSTADGSTTISVVDTVGNQIYGNVKMDALVTSSTGTLTFNGVVTVLGDSTLQADKIDFNGGAGSVQGQAQLILLPESRGMAVTIGGSGTGLVLNGLALSGYAGSLYIGAGPQGVGITLPVMVGDITIDQDIKLVGNGTLLLAGLGNISWNTGTLAAGTVILVAGSQDSVMTNTGGAGTGIDATTVILVAGGQIGQPGNEFGLNVTTQGKRVEVATGVSQTFLVGPDRNVIFIGSSATVADTIAAELGLVLFGGATPTNAGTEAAINMLSGSPPTLGLPVFGEIDDTPMFDIEGAGVSMPSKFCVDQNGHICSQ
jgi:hypothetical protein